MQVWQHVVSFGIFSLAFPHNSSKNHFFTSFRNNFWNFAKPHRLSRDYMRKTSLNIIFLTFLFVGCINTKKRDEQKNPSSNVIADKNELQKFETTAIALIYERDTLLTITTEKYDSILKYELVEIPKYSKTQPDSLYFKNAYNTLNYGSEQGQDLYYLIYARYLSLNDNKHIPKAIKDELEELFYSINLFIQTNGTF